MKTSTISLKALSLSVAALALNAGVAHASTIGIYGGGSTLSYVLDDQVGQCVGLNNATYSSDKATGLTCTNNAAYEYLFAGQGSGSALIALTTNFNSVGQNAVENPPGGSPGYAKNYHDTATGLGPLTSTTTPGYPSWELSFSDAPFDTLDPISLSGLTFAAEYAPSSTQITNAYFPSGFVSLAKYRGAIWQIPVTATPVALPYNLPSAAFGSGFYDSNATATVTTGSGSSTHTGTVTELDLSTDMVCYIWTQNNAKGTLTTATAGTYTWDNAIFSGKTVKSGTITNVSAFDSNLIKANVAGLAIQPLMRPDASGTTYLFTLWLSKNCKNYTTAGWGAPSVLPTHPTFVALSGSGSGGMQNSVKGLSGSIGYLTPDKVAPVSGTIPAAFVQIPNNIPTGSNKSSFLYPTSGNTALAETGVALPTAITATKWGTALNKAFFKQAAANNGYAIVGLTYVMGYSCYDNDSTNNEFDGVQQYLNYLGTADFQTLALGQGFAPLTQAQYQSAVALVEASMHGVSATPIPAKTKTGKPTTGPTACPLFTTAAQDYQ